MKIGFACTTIFHYQHFRKIAEQFQGQYCFVIFAPRFVRERLGRLETFFSERAIPYYHYSDLITGELSLDALISPYFKPAFQFLEPQMLRIRVLYGYAKDAWNYAEWNGDFDHILVYGRYATERLEYMAPCSEIGHPRYVPLPDGKLPQEIFDINGYPLSQWLDGKPLLLYCPTWGDLSSLPYMQEYLEDIADDYQLVLKLHHGNVLSDNLNLKALVENRKLFICDETTDLFHLFPVAQLVISDYSGAIFDAILARKKLLLLDTFQGEVKDTGIVNLKKMTNINNYERFVRVQHDRERESLDMAVRRLFPHLSQLTKLNEAIREQLDLPYAEPTELLEELYTFQDGEAHIRGAKVIRELIDAGNYKTRSHDREFELIEKTRLHQFLEANRSDHFIIWGAGELGQLIYYWMKKLGYSLHYFIDADPIKHDKALEDKKIKALALLNEPLLPPAKVIVSTIYGHDEVKAYLEARGFKEEQDYIYPFKWKAEQVLKNL